MASFNKVNVMTNTRTPRRFCPDSCFTRTLRRWTLGGRLLPVLLLLALAVAASGCMPRYRITLTSGSFIDTKGKPKLNKEQSAWLYTDVQGRQGVVPAFRVQEIAPK